MTPIRTLAIALLALTLTAAHTIPQIAPELEKKLAEVIAEAIKEEKPADIKDKPIENASSEQELIDQANTIKDVENNLRTKPTEIPVKVVVEEAKPALKASSEETTSETDVKRAEPDLLNPGNPEHQEHNAQNAVHYEDSQALLSSIKKTILDSQAAFNQGFSAVSENVQNFFLKNEQAAPIKESIKELHDSFSKQIEKLNNFVRTSIVSVNQNAIPVPEKKVVRSELETIESRLKHLESRFQKGLNTISNGVELFAEVKAESSEAAAPAATAENVGEAASAPDPAPAPAPAPAPPPTSLGEVLTSFQASIQSGLTSVQTAFGNLLGQGQGQQTQVQNDPQTGAATDTSNQPTPGLFQNPLNIFQNIFNRPGNAPPAGTQSDEVTTTLQPNIIQQFQQGLAGVQNFLFPAQQGQQQQVQSDEQQQQTPNQPNQPNRPFDLANIPVIGPVVTFLQRPPATQPIVPADPARKPANPTKKPADTVKPQEPESEVSNAKPEEPKKEGLNEVPPKTEPAATTLKPEPPKGPIQQISQQIQKNPIVKGIQGAVQRLQHTISRSPDEPRDALKEKKPDGANDVNPKSDFESKGHHDHDHHSSGSNHDSSERGLIQEKEKEQVKPSAEETQKSKAPLKESELLQKPEKSELPEKSEEPQKSEVPEKSEKPEKIEAAPVNTDKQLE